MNRIIFLDIDGVCNRLDQQESFHPSCVEQLNRILAVTESSVVLSSAWRYLLVDQDDAPRAMNLSGFSVMLRTHGVRGLKLIGHTPTDEQHPESAGNRGAQIRHWLRENRRLVPVDRYVVIDDNDYGISAESLPFVKTDPWRGLNVESAGDVIRLLTREPAGA